MKVVLLAGGLGTRLTPVTGYTLPKALVPVNGVPFIDLKLTELEGEGEQIAHRSAQFERQIGAERVRLNQLTSATLTTGVEGVAWDFLIDDGE